MSAPQPHDPPPVSGPETGEWFRAPTRREHVIGAALFVGFALFFVALFVVLNGWWFRWVILVLGGVSLLRGLRRAANAARSGPG